MTRVQLGVNVDHVATLRQARGTCYPDPVEAAVLAQEAGADQITIHLREDRRHIIDSDLPKMTNAVSIPINLEMAATDEMQRIALEHRPARITLVPEKREEQTTEGGLDVASHMSTLRQYITPFQDAGIVVSMFIDPDPHQIRASVETGAQAIELHTGDYADAATSEEQSAELQKLADGAVLGRELGLEVAAGHGLHYTNTQAILTIRDIVELNIGHSIVGRAVLVGMSAAVREMRTLMDTQ